MSYNKKQKESDQQKPNENLYIPPANRALLAANLEAIGGDLPKILEKVQDVEVAIEDDVKVHGLKNPIYLVIVGFSGRKILEAARKSKKEIVHVLIIEPDLRVFKQTMARNWIGDLTADGTVDLLVGIPPEEMMPHLYRIFTHVDKYGNRAGRCQQPEIIYDPFVYPAKDAKNHPVVDRITKLVIEASKQVFLAMGCGSDSFFRFEQLIRNEKNLESTYRIAPLFGKFSEVPVIVLGAGPSLQDFIEAAHEYKIHEKCLVIACDAALKLLLKHGIKPHIVTRCERKLTTIFSGIKKEDTKDFFYAAYPWCPPDYFDLFENSFMLFRGNGLCKWSEYDPGEVNGGVSSANAALELAYLLGAKEIILSGVDLCFIGERSHIEGTEVEFDIEKSRPKWTKIMGNSGEEVTTIPIWNRCLNEYRTSLARYGNQAKVYNTSLNGAKIEGTTIKSIKEVAERLAHDNKDKPNPIEIIKSKLEKHTPGYAETLREKKKTTISYLEKALHDLNKLFGNIDDCLLIAGREEERTFTQVKGYSSLHEYYANVASIKSSLLKVYQEPARQIDAYKKVYFGSKIFDIVILDTIQVDWFQLENKLAGLKNVYEVEHERLKAYVTMNAVFLREVQYYLKEYIRLLKDGPDQTVDYSKIIEGLD